MRHEHCKTFVSRLLGRYKDREARECTVLLPDKHSLLLRVTIDLNVLSQDCFVQFPLKEKSAPAPDSLGCSTVIFMGGNNMSYCGPAGRVQEVVRPEYGRWEHDNGASI